MASASIFGGGFFFAPFSQSAQYSIQIACVAPPAYGPWSSYITNVTFKARWLTVWLYNGLAGVNWSIQLGLGPPGGEVLWQPSLATGLLGAVDGFTFHMESNLLGFPVLSFPISLETGQQLSARGRTALVGLVTVRIAMWG